jgi:hypothetical protein
MNNNDLKDFLLECHIDTSALVSLAGSLMRSIQASEYETAQPHPDSILVKLLAERIKDLDERIGDRL